MATQNFVFSAIAQYPPIMVPEVGRESIARVEDSIEAMAELTQRLIDSGAEFVIVIPARSTRSRFVCRLPGAPSKSTVISQTLMRPTPSPPPSMKNYWPRSKMPLR